MSTKPLSSLLTRAFQHPVAPATALGLALAAALALQHVFGWAPCPLCIVQRLTAIALALILVGYALAPQNSKDYLLAAGALVTGAGLLSAGAHLTLLYAPTDGTCGPGLALAVSRLVDAIPGTAWLLEGAGACADTRYAVFGIPLAAWSALAHVGALSLAIWQRHE